MQEKLKNPNKHNFIQNSKFLDFYSEFLKIFYYCKFKYPYRISNN